MAFQARRILVSTVLILSVLAASIGIAWQLNATKPQAVRTDTPALPPLVKIHTLQRRDIRDQFVGYGSARAEHDVSIAAEVSGLIVETADGLNEGVHVQEGEQLLRIDDRSYRQRLARVEANQDELRARIAQLDVERLNNQKLAAIADEELAVSRAEFERVGDLKQRNLAAKKEVDFARLAYRQSQRQLQTFRNLVALIEPRRQSLVASLAAGEADAELARLDLEKCVIRAPFAGRIVALLVEKGDHVMPATQMLRLVDPKLIEVPVSLPASAYSMVRVGVECALYSDTLPDQSWRGRIARIAPLADARSRTFSAFVEVDNAEQTSPLIAGYFLKANVQGPIYANVFAIDRAALVNNRVFVANGAHAHRRDVSITRYIGENAIIEGDIAAGDEIILTNLDVLFDGADVRVGDGDEPEPRREDAGQLPVIAGGGS